LEQKGADASFFPSSFSSFPSLNCDTLPTRDVDGPVNQLITGKRELMVMAAGGTDPFSDGD